MWDVVYSEDWGNWFDGLTDPQQVALVAAIDVLRQKGPALGRPLVDRVSGSAYHNMKELRVSEGGDLRSLFAFDANRMAVLLVGGDKTGEWGSWYDENIPRADELFTTHQEPLVKKGGRKR